MHKLHIIDIAVIITYLALCLIIGYFSAKKITNIKEYALGGRNISTFMLVGTMLATCIGAGNIMGTAEKVYSIGVIFILATACKPIFWVVTSKVFCNNITYFKEKNCISVSDIMEVLYGNHARWVTNILSLITSVIILVTQITAMGYLLNYFLGIPSVMCSLIGFSVLITYSFMGGVRSVIFTDFFQAGMFFIGIPLAAYLAYDKLGGFYEIVSKLPSSHTTIEFSKGNLILLFSLAFHYFLPESSNAFVQRYLMANNEKQLKTTLLVSLIMYIPFILIVSFVGWMVKAANSDIDPNITFFYLLTEYMPVGILGLLVAGLLAAIMSTADSLLNTTSVLVAHDIVKKLFPKISNLQEVRIAKSSILFISAIAAFLALNSNQSILSLVWLANTLWSPLIEVALIAGFFKFRTNSTSFICSCIIAVIFMLAGRYISGEFGVITQEVSMVGSLIGLFGSHYIQKHLGMLKKEEVAYVYSTSSKSLKSNFTLKGAFSRLLKAANLEIENNGKLHGMAMIICLVYYILTLFFWSTILNSNIDLSVIILKTIGALLCLSFYMYEYGLKNSLTKHFPFYYYLILTWTFPMITNYTIYLYGLDVIWIVELVFGMMILYTLTGIRAMSILMIIGIIFGCTFGVIRLTYGPVFFYGLNASISSIYALLIGSILFLIVKTKDNMLQSKIAHEAEKGNIIAHQVRQPISYAYMCADVMINTFDRYSFNSRALTTVSDYTFRPHDFETVKELSKDLKDVADKGNKLITDILTLSRTDMDKAEDMGEYDIREIVEGALEFHIKNPVRAKRIEVDLNNNFRVKGSRHFLIHAVGNVIENSMKYAGSNAILRIWCEDQKLYLRDNGVGMDSQEVYTIFEKYKHMDGKFGGTGLGMYFCKKVIEAYGGTIKAASVKGEYMEIVFAFPNL